MLAAAMTIATIPKSIMFVQFDDGGKTLAIGTTTGRFELRSVPEGKLLHSMRLSESGRVLAGAFSPDGKRIAVGGASDGVEVFDVASGQVALSRRKLECRSIVNAIQFSPDGVTRRPWRPIAFKSRVLL